MDLHSIKAQTALDLITGGISAGLFLLMTALNWFLAYSSKFLVLFGSLFLLFLIFRRIFKKPFVQVFTRYGLIICGVMVLFSCAGAIYHWLRQNSTDERALRCDYTELAIDTLFTRLPWMEANRLEDNTIRFFVGTRDQARINDYVRRYTTVPSFNSELERDTTIYTPIYPVGGAVKAESKTRLVGFDLEWARPGYEDEFLKPLPMSVNHTVAGLLLLNNNEWTDAISILKDALDDGNGVAGYLLYLAYTLHANGLGTGRERELATSYLKQSADLGYRRAQLEYGKQLLAKGGDIDIALGVQYLKRASRLSEFRTPSVMNTMHRAVEALLEYYIKTGQFKQAYSFTKNLVKENKLEYLIYQYHLENCLRTGRYSEARDIIQKGFNSKDPQNAGYCKVIQAKMFHEGLGINQDLRKAELALRYASDSLDYPYARKKLAEFYSQEGYEDDASFWQRLYDIHFRNTVKE